MNKHTPGEWRVEAGGARLIQTTACVISAGDGLGPVAYATTMNAQLIAESPALLEACKRLIGSLGAMVPDADSDPDIIFARAAIAKAEGKQ